MSFVKDMKQVVGHLKAQGFEVEIAANGHYKVISPTGAKCQIAYSPRNTRTIMNHITRLKRIGFVPPRK